MYSGQNDQEILVPIGNIIECCIDGVLRANKTNKKDREQYKQKAVEELKLLHHFLDDLSKDQNGPKYVIETVNCIRKMEGFEQLDWLTPFLHDLEERATTMIGILPLVQMENSTGLASSQWAKPLVRALASLAIVSFLAGFTYFWIQPKFPEKNIVPEHREESIINNSSDESVDRSKEVWQNVGLQVFSIDEKEEELKLRDAVNDWGTVQIQEYDIDVMTS